jgi:spore germination protein YaaH
VDFEGAGVNGDYAGFVSALAQRLHADGRQLSAALASWYGSKVTDVAIAAFDFVNVMAYDLHNPAGTTNPVSGSSLADSRKEIDYWVDRGLDRSRAVLGVPFYGYRWTSAGKTGEAITYAQILDAYGDAAASSDVIEQDGTTIYYDGTDTVAAKVTLAKDYGGTMIWELSQDAAGAASLLRAMHEAD